MKGLRILVSETYQRKMLIKRARKQLLKISAVSFQVLTVTEELGRKQLDFTHPVITSFSELWQNWAVPGERKSSYRCKGKVQGSHWGGNGLGSQVESHTPATHSVPVNRAVPKMRMWWYEISVSLCSNFLVPKPQSVYHSESYFK